MSKRSVRSSRARAIQYQTNQIEAPIIWTYPADIVARRRRRRLKLAFSSLSLLIFMVSLSVGFNTWRLNRTAKSEVSALAPAKGSSANQVPDEVPSPGLLDNYRVAADAPRIISIPRLRITSRVQKVEMTDDTLKAPTNINNAGWYAKGAKPDESGAVVIDGYTKGPTRAGVFYNLKKLVAGDKIQIEKGDGSTVNYKVVKLQSYLKDEINPALLTTPLAHNTFGLNIITYDGQPSDNQNPAFARQLVVFAVQIK